MVVQSDPLLVAETTQGAARLLGGLLLWIVVCIALVFPLAILVRAMARRRGAPLTRPSAEEPRVDAWRESARRMEARE
jgi:hypothetical protein